MKAIVLAGGRAARLGGASKPGLEVGGQRVLDRVLAALAAAGVREVVVVGPDGVAPSGVPTALEDPPFGGPVAGIAAGMAHWWPSSGAPEAGELVAVLACDLPFVADGAAALLAADAADADAVCLAGPDGRPQWLAAVYAAPALHGALAALPRTRDISVRALVAPLRLVAIPTTDRATFDVDTWEDLATARAQVEDR